MIIVTQLSNVAELLLDAAESRSTVSFNRFHGLFDASISNNDKYDTLEAASRALCPSSLAIYSAVMAKTGNGCPGSGFYDIFNNLRRDEFAAIAGHNDLHQLTDEHRKAIASIERGRVYEHAKENF